MSSQVELSGQLVVGGGVSGGCCNGGGVKVQSLGLRCNPGAYRSVVSTDNPVQVQTPGVIGNAWVELPLIDALSQVELLMVQADAPLQLRIGAAPAEVAAVGGVFPTLFAGGEVLGFAADGAVVTTTFTAGAQAAAQVAAEINAAAMIASLAYLPASVGLSGQLVLRGLLTGKQGSLVVTAGAPAAALGLSTMPVVGAGADVPVYGTFLAEFGRAPDPSVPRRVQVSGVARISVFAAGNTP